jgi:hypothetical protein
MSFFILNLRAGNLDLSKPTANENELVVGSRWDLIRIKKRRKGG